jgi:hypothetical protein
VALGNKNENGSTKSVHLRHPKQFDSITNLRHNLYDLSQDISSPNLQIGSTALDSEIGISLDSKSKMENKLEQIASLSHIDESSEEEKWDENDFDEFPI